jgi:hypothetical protein
MSISQVVVIVGTDGVVGVMLWESQTRCQSFTLESNRLSSMWVATQRYTSLLQLKRNGQPFFPFFPNGSLRDLSPQYV